MSDPSKRAMPEFTPEAVPYWDGTREGKLLYQQCRDCGTIQFPFQTLCRKCLASRLEARASTGVGKIVTFSTVFRAPTPSFASEVPYTVVLVELEEGYRMLSSLIGEKQEEVAIGASVRVVFQQCDTWTLPRFELMSRN